MRYAVVLLSLLVVPNGCSSAGGAKRTDSTNRSRDSRTFRDIAQSSGVNFVHSNGASGRFYFIESTPAGCALFDFDNDGSLDIFLVQSGPSSPPHLKIDRPHCALFRNTGIGTFADVTEGSGLDRDLGYGQGVAVGDYDNDGYEDLLVTTYGGIRLFHNEQGTGKFSDTTQSMGLALPYSTGYATSAAFGDFDSDGALDLYVCYYCPWTWDRQKHCNDSLGRLEYCSPEVYEPVAHRLYRNDRRRFSDVSQLAGITNKKGRGLAVAFIDDNEDGHPDIFVANDLTPNMLWRNNGNGTFTDVATRVGCAYSEGGTLMAAMGIGIGDYDHSGRESIFVTNFSGLPNTLFRVSRDGFFQDVSKESRLAQPHMKFLAFGCEFLDYDADGWLDLLVANGHVLVRPDVNQAGVTREERKQLFHNERNGRFREIVRTKQLGDLAIPTVSRGLAVGDVDNDGRLDALVSNQNGPAQLFHNEVVTSNHWISFRPMGTKSNRSGVHAKFTLQAAGQRQVATVRGGSSYLSHSDLRVYFGLGRATRVDQLDVKWPSGAHDVFKNLNVDSFYTVTEGHRAEPSKK